MPIDFTPQLMMQLEAAGLAPGAPPPKPKWEIEKTMLGKLTPLYDNPYNIPKEDWNELMEMGKKSPDHPVHLLKDVKTGRVAAALTYSEVSKRYDYLGGNGSPTLALDDKGISLGPGARMDYDKTFVEPQENAPRRMPLFNVSGHTALDLSGKQDSKLIQINVCTPTSVIKFGDRTEQVALEIRARVADKQEHTLVIPARGAESSVVRTNEHGEIYGADGGARRVYFGVGNRVDLRPITAGDETLSPSPNFGAKILIPDPQGKKAASEVALFENGMPVGNAKERLQAAAKELLNPPPQKRR